MNWLRYALIAGICAVSYMLFLEWNAFEEARIAADTSNTETLSSSPLPQLSDENTAIPVTADPSNADLPPLPGETEVSTEAPKAVENSTQSQLISITTDSFDILIDTRGGDIVKVALPKHLAHIDSDEPFILMNRSAALTYVARSGLVGANGTDNPSADRPIYSVEKNSWSMAEGEDSLSVDLQYQQGDVTITKRYTFFRGEYRIGLDYLIDNQSNAIWKAAPHGQIRRDGSEVEANVGIGMQPYLGAAMTTLDKNYDKVKFSEIEKETVNLKRQGGWVAMVQHYFISAWIPNSDAQNVYRLRYDTNNHLYILEYFGSLTSVQPNSQGKISAEFYAGPKNLREMEALSPYLDLTLDYSWLWFIAKPLFFALDYIHGFVGNWGIAIILLTVLIKLVFFYPSAMSYRSMAKMRKLQPMMADLKERYGDDRQKMSAELMKIYRKEKVNPLGGCLPILLQMPVFISLYWVLMESVELRHAPFMLWINDLSVKDPFFILPLIMGATMFIQQKLNPTPPDPMQAKVMQWMPVFFTVLFLWFPAGLVLYWVVNNTLSIAQQYVITRQIEKGSD